MRKMRTLFSLVAVLACCSQAAAQTLYKSVRPDGSVEYSDKPSRDAVKVERYEIAPVNPQDAAREAQQRAEDQRRLREFEQREHRRKQALDSADAELNAALEALKIAQQRLNEGLEPQPGEITGTVRGLTRRNDAYYERMQRLGQDVVEAQRRIDRAYAARNGVRD